MAPGVRTRSVIAIAALAVAAALGPCSRRDDVPARVWLGWARDSDALDLLDGLYSAPHGEKVIGYDAEHTEDSLDMYRVTEYPTIERLLARVGISRTCIHYTATGHCIDSASWLWVEYSRDSANGE